MRGCILRGSPPGRVDGLFIVARNYFRLFCISCCLGKQCQDTAGDVDSNDLR
jgi:hypothetical protein